MGGRGHRRRHGRLDPSTGKPRYLRLELLEDRRLLALTGDMDLDLEVDFDDIDDLVLGLTDPAEYQRRFDVAPHLTGDTSGDGRLDTGDIPRFVELLFARHADFFAGLVNDTALEGTVDGDGLTSDPAIFGVVLEGLDQTASLRAQLDAQSPVEIDLNESGSFLFDPGLPRDGTGDGHHRVRFVLTDVEGQTSAIFDVPFTLDTVPPSTPMFGLDPAFDTEPLGDQRTTRDAVTLLGTTDDAVAVTLVETGAETAPDASGAFVFPAVILDVGANPLTVRVADAAGNQATASRSIRRLLLGDDVEPPAVQAELTNDTGRDAADGVTSDSTIAGMIVDNESVGLVELTIPQMSSGSLDITGMVDPDTGALSLSQDIVELLLGNPLPDGSYTYRIQAEDFSGNASDPFELPFTLDRTPPDPPMPPDLSTLSDTGTSNNDDVTRETVVTLRVDAETGSLVTLSVDGQNVAQAEATSHAEFAAGPLDDGDHSITATATDLAGNASATSQALTITVDTVPPAPALDAPAAGQTINSRSRITGSMDGTGSSADMITYELGGLDPVPVAADQHGRFDRELQLAGVPDGLNTLSVAAFDRAGNMATTQVDVDVARDSVTFALVDHMPLDGANEVGVTFHPQIFFSKPVDPATLGTENLFASIGGRKLPATIVPAGDGQFAWLFFEEPLPGSSRIQVTVDGSTIFARHDGQALDADRDGEPGGVLTYDFTTVSRMPLAGTRLSGIVADPGPDRLLQTADDFDRGPDGVAGTEDDIFLLPIPGVKVYLLGLESEVRFTDANGRFSFDAVPAGDVKVVVDGTTATNPPAGMYFPEMVMDAMMTAGADNSVMPGLPEVYLPRLSTDILQPVDASTETMIVANAQGAPDLSPGQRQLLSLQIPPGSLVAPDGSSMTAADVGISTVPPEFVRTMLPPGVLQETFNITIQAPGVSNFSTPAPMTFPNVYGAAPGTQLNLISFDHTTGRLVMEGTGTVTVDGLSVRSDPGMGIVHPGWHSFTPEGSPLICEAQCDPKHTVDKLAFIIEPLPVVGEQEPSSTDLSPLRDHLFFTADEGFNLFFRNEAVVPKDIDPQRVGVIPMDVSVQIDAAQPASKGKAAAADFLQGIASKHSFRLLPGEDDTIGIKVKPLDTKTLVSLANQFENILAGQRVHIKVTALDKNSLPQRNTKVLLDETYYYYRFYDLTDLDNADQTISFEDTVVDDVFLGLRREAIELLTPDNSKPQLEIQNPADPAFRIVNPDPALAARPFPVAAVIFTPSTVVDQIGNHVVVKTPAPGAAGDPPARTVGTIDLEGDGTAAQKVFLDPDGLNEVLRQIAEGPPPREFILNRAKGPFGIAIDGKPVSGGFLPLDTDAADVQRLLEAQPKIDTGNVSVTRQERPFLSYTIALKGRFAGQPDPPQLIVFQSGDRVVDVAKKQVVFRPARMSSTEPDRNVLITTKEKDEFNSAEKRQLLVGDVIDAVKTGFSFFGDSIQFVDQASNDSINLNWRTSALPGLGGNSQPQPSKMDDGIDNDDAMQSALAFQKDPEDPLDESLPRRAFRFSEAVNQSAETRVDVMVDNLLEQPFVQPLTLTRAQMINVLSKVALHEIAHTLGSRHSAQGSTAFRQLESQHLFFRGGNDDSEYILKFDGEPIKAPLKKNSSAEEIKEALENLDNIPEGSLHVKLIGTIGFEIVFGDPPGRRVWAGTDLPQITAEATSNDGLRFRASTRLQGASDQRIAVVVRPPVGGAAPIPRPAIVEIDGVSGTEDIMAGGFFDAEGKLRFTEPMSRATLSVGLDFADGPTAVKAIRFFEANRANGPFDAVGMPDTDLLPPVDGPQLEITDHADVPLLGSADLGTISVDGPGMAVGNFQVGLLNSGSDPLELDRIDLIAPNNDISLDGAAAKVVLQPLESLPFTITFDPQSSGAFEATLRVESNDPDGPAELDLTGFGLSPDGDIRLDVPNNNAGGVRIGEGSATLERFATVRNIGAGQLAISDLVMGNFGLGQFDVGGLPDGFGPENPLVLEPDETLQLDLIFDPSVTGLQRGSLTLLSDDADTPALVQTVVGTGLPDAGTGVDFGNDFVAVDFPLESNAVQLRDISDGEGHFDFFFAPETSFQVSIFDPVSGLIANFLDRSAPSGQQSELSLPMFVASAANDSDGDGLPDDIEFTIGTAADAADTDGDGLDDFSAVQQGLDPAGGLGSSGIIGAVALDGVARDVAIAASPEDANRMLAYVATGASGGLAIVDVTDPSIPVVLAQMELEGENTDVRVDALTNMAVVGGGSAGVHLVDVRDPAEPEFVRTIPTGKDAQAVETHAGFAYVADGVRLLAIDLRAGRVVGRPLLASQQPITDIARQGNRLYTMDGSITLHVIDVAGPTMTMRGSLDTVHGGTQLFVDRDVAYMAARFTFGGGFATVDVSDPDQPAIISLSDASGGAALPRDGIVTNGSGLGLLISGSGNQGLSIMDVSDPEVTNAFLAGFALPEFAHAVTIGAGRAYLANGSAGLQVVNFQTPDTQGQPPTVALTTLADDADPAVDGLQVQEGSLLSMLVDVTEDVQVRRVDLLVNGQIVGTDYNNPYDMSFQVPLIEDGAGQITLQARATDTGGNMSLSEPLEVELLPDTSGPRIVRVDPPQDGTRPPGEVAVEITFDELIDPSTVSSATFQLRNSSGSPVAADGEPLLVSGRTVQLTLSNLSADDYEVFVDSDQVTDGVGNALGTDDVVGQFSVIDGTVFWINPLGGSWNEPANWSTGNVPGPADDVVVGVPGDVVVELNQIGDVSVRRLFSEERLSVIQLEVAIDQQGRLGGGVDLSRGGLRIGGPVTLAGTSLWINTTSVLGGGVLNHEGTLHSFTQQVTVEPVLNNRGTILQGDNRWTVDEVNNLAGATYEFTGFSTLMGADGVLNNQGTLIRRGADLTTVSVPVNNAGVLDVQGGTLWLSAFGGSSANDNAIYHVADGSALHFGAGQHSFSGTSRFDGEGRLRIFGNAPIVVENGAELTLDLNGAGVLVDSGTDITIIGSLVNDGRIVWNGGRVDIMGQMINRGTLDLANSSSGTLSGTLDNEGTLLQSNRALTVDGATINNLAGGVFEITASAGINDVAGTINVLNNFGTLTKSGGAGFTNFGLPVINAGLMQLQIGTSNFLQGITQTAGTLALSGGTLAGNGPVDLQGGLLTGAGRITTEVINGATIEVGGAGIAGLLEITRPYTQTSTGALNVELGGTQPQRFDRLELSGTMTLAGVLDVGLIEGFTPSDVDSFDILTFGTRIGDSQFETVVLAVGLETVVYDEAGGRVTVQ